MAKNVKPGKLRGNTNPNLLTADENDYTLSIIGGMSYSLKDLAQLVTKSGITTLREDQLIDGFRLIAEKGVEMALQGNNVNYDYFTLRCGVKGVFNSPNEPFDPSKHQVTASMSVSQEVRKAMDETLVENMGPAQHYAQMDTIINTVSGEKNLTLTSGQVLDIRGINLTVKGDDPSVGVFIQEEGAAAGTRIKVTILLNNEPKRLMFMVPASVQKDKTYRIVHISQAGTGTNQLVKTPRTAISGLLKATDGTLKPDDGGSDENPDIL